MQDGENGANAPKVQNKPTEQLIPKSRLDEVIQDRNRSRDEVQGLTRTVQNLTQMIQQQQQRVPRPQVQNPMFKKLREEGREAEAKMFYDMEQQLVQQRQISAALVDETDRTRFLTRYGKKAEKRLGDVEQQIEVARQRGNFNLSREQAYLNILGYEQLQKETQDQEVPQTPAHAPRVAAAPKAHVDYNDGDSPSTDPNDVSSIRQGGASEGFEDQERGERLSEVQDLEF